MHKPIPHNKLGVCVCVCVCVCVYASQVALVVKNPLDNAGESASGGVVTIRNAGLIPG